jgi:broad specificity phosphatase PhoE
MAVVFQVEHGDTKYDEKGCAQGLLDDGLTEKGKQQARTAARALKGKGIDCIYTSPMKRARETATIIAQKIGALVIVRPNLEPLDIGALAGKKIDTVLPYLEFFSARPTLSFPEGGTYGDYYDRARKEWIHQFGDDDPVIAVVCHARDFQLMSHWQKHGLNADVKGISFEEPGSAQVSKVTRSGNSIQTRKIA